MANVKGVLATLFLVFNAIWWSILVYLLAAVRVLTPGERAREAISAIMDRVIDGWVACNAWMLGALRITRIDMDAADGSQGRDSWHVIVSNHQGWSDILVLQTIFRRSVPPLKFFVKRPLLWVPFLGFAMWLLGFPYVRRFPRAQLEANPALREIDRQATLKACQRFLARPTSVLNFLEGTRFTPQKHSGQGSPFRHLLTPKTGGLAYVVSSMGARVDHLTDVTIFYPGRAPTFWEFLCGRCPNVRVEVGVRDIPAELRRPAEELPASARAQLRAWVDALWSAKDARLDELLHTNG